jgi:CRP-like cAMP-binding protein
VADLLEMVAHFPVVDLAPGDVLIDEGTRTGSVWVLVSGAVEILKHGAVINRLNRPGLTFGEVSLLTDADHSATVRAVEPSRFHVATDGRALLLESPEVLFFMASGLAERLDLVTSYLADLRNQYTGAPGIDMVSDVLGRLVHPAASTVEPGSRRDPDPDD